jgi:FtsP/CotA-like multicopper oxidase with cupredoxin domain
MTAFNLKNLSRRDLLKLGSLGTLGAVSAHHLLLQSDHGAQPKQALKERTVEHAGHSLTVPGGCGCELSTASLLESAEMNPTKFLTTFDYGKVSQLPDGRTLREYEIVAEDKVIEVAAAVKFPAWTYNGFVPGPTLRATEGDFVRVKFTNLGSHAHSIHFHGIHPANMDGLAAVAHGGRFTYEFTAEPFGLHLYHCHVMPLKRHIHKGLYGTFIVDPKTPRSPATEMVMVMNGYDLDQDSENEFYTVNGVAFWFNDHPIELRAREQVRIYLVNLTEFDLINSIHLHANLFHYYPTGTSLTPRDYTDTVMLCQGERGILEFEYKTAGRFMFHAHQSEFAELGWMGFIDVKPGDLG